MKLRNINIDESIKSQFKKALEDEHTVLDPTTADALQNEEDVRKQLDKDFKENDKAADDLIKATAPEEKTKVKNRKELTKLLSENKNRRAKISRCLDEGFRYLVEWMDEEEKEPEVQEEACKQEENCKVEEEVITEESNYDKVMKVINGIGNGAQEESLEEANDVHTISFNVKKFCKSENEYKELTDKIKDICGMKSQDSWEDDDEVWIKFDANENEINKISEITGIDVGFLKKNIDESLKEDNSYFHKIWKQKDDEEQFIQQMVCQLYSKFSDMSRSTIYDLVANLKKDFPEKDFDGLYEIVESAIVDKTADDYLDTGNTKYLKLKKESLEEDEEEDVVITKEIECAGGFGEEELADYPEIKLISKRDKGNFSYVILQGPKSSIKELFTKENGYTDDDLFLTADYLLGPDLVKTKEVQIAGGFDDSVLNDWENIKVASRRNEGNFEFVSFEGPKDDLEEFIEQEFADGYTRNDFFDESLKEDKKGKIGKGTVGEAINKNRKKIDELVSKNKTEMVRAVSKILEDDSIEDKAYAKEVLRNVSKKRTSQEILIYLYDIMLKQIGLGSPDAPDAKKQKEEEPAEEKELLVSNLNEEIVTEEKFKEDDLEGLDAIVKATKKTKGE